MWDIKNVPHFFAKDEMTFMCVRDLSDRCDDREKVLSLFKHCDTII